MHPLLARQLRLLALAPDRPPSPEAWGAFLQRVDASYAQADQDRYMHERAVATCSEEMEELYEELRGASEAELAKKSRLLEESLSLARGVQDAVAEGICVYEGDEVLCWNRRFEEMWGHPAEILEQRSVKQLLAFARTLVEHPEVVEERRKRTGASELPCIDEVRFRDGRIFERYAAPVGPGSGRRLVVFRDVTSERRIAEQRAVVAERMTSLGQLVASVAHEINNPLTFVKANLEFLRDDLAAPVPDSEARMEALADACTGIERVAVIVRDLRALSHLDVEERALVDVNRLLETALHMASNQIRHKAIVKTHFATIPTVYANEGRLLQVFLNLLVNAAQAIESGPTSENEITVTTAVTGNGHVRIQIRDTGTGIEPSKLERIFDPFYTTKPVGSGTGLGLSICKGIIAKLDGRIDVQSELGRGTVFSVELRPAVDVASSMRPPESESPSERLRVLVVDDEQMVGRALARMLRAHDVTTVTSVDGAVRALEDEEFDIVLCDVMMPDRTGIDMHREVQERWPELLSRVVFMSGGAFTPTLEAFLQQPRIRSLAKPISPAALFDAIGALVA